MEAICAFCKTNIENLTITNSKEAEIPFSSIWNLSEEDTTRYNWVSATSHALLCATHCSINFSNVKFSNCQKIQIQLNSRATFKKCDFINMIYAIACAYNSTILFYGYFNFSVHSCIYMSNCSITILDTYSPNLVDKFDYALKLTITGRYNGYFLESYVGSNCVNIYA